ncbi:MAG: serine/threonine protein kinase [Myxococcota bacterium]|nr:serine/threonine protein kinase [Myxococcota bacterium]
MNPLPSANSCLVLGRYLLFDEIASGGMATVHFGRLSGPAGFSRVVAIKRLHPNFARDPEFVTMFLDEARLAARVRHPNVVATVDVVAMEGETFLVMEYVHGESLAKLWRTTRAAGKQVDARIVATVMSGVLHGLHAAHEAKDERGQSLEIVHRDVSPQNILVSADGVAGVLDFGVAKAAGRVQTTREGRIKGKLAYMPPEQLHGADVTRRTDVYAAAVVTWELLTGQRAFRRDNEAAVVTAILAESLQPPSKVAPHVPSAFDDVVMRGLRHNPLRRYATAQEMALELERCVGIASMSRVAEWVHSVAHIDLARRALRIAAIERMIGAAPSVPPRTAADETTTTRVGKRGDAASDAPSGISRIAVSSTLAHFKRRWLERVAVGAAVAVSALLLVGVFMVRALTRDRSPPAVAFAVASSEPSGPAFNVTPAVAVDNQPPRVAVRVTPALPAAPIAPPSAAVSSGDRKSVAPPHNPHVGALPVHNPAKTKIDCDPPFTIDESGHKHYKVSCLE